MVGRANSNLPACLGLFYYRRNILMDRLLSRPRLYSQEASNIDIYTSTMQWPLGLLQSLVLIIPPHNIIFPLVSLLIERIIHLSLFFPPFSFSARDISIAWISFCFTNNRTDLRQSEPTRLLFRPQKLYVMSLIVVVLLTYVNPHYWPPENVISVLVSLSVCFYR